MGGCCVSNHLLYSELNEVEETSVAITAKSKYLLLTYANSYSLGFCLKFLSVHRKNEALLSSLNLFLKESIYSREQLKVSLGFDLFQLVNDWKTSLLKTALQLDKQIEKLGDFQRTMTITSESQVDMLNTSSDTSKAMESIYLVYQQVLSKKLSLDQGVLNLNLNQGLSEHENEVLESFRAHTQQKLELLLKKVGTRSRLIVRGLS